MLSKALFSLVLLTTAFANSLFAQITVTGPKEATVGYMLKLKLDLQVDDPQIKCFPENDDWLATKDFSGQSWIIYVPGKKSLQKTESSKLITFVIAGNKDKKTFLATHEVTVKRDEDEPIPVPPDDSITKTELYKKLHAAFMVEPSNVLKTKLSGVYEEAASKAGTFRSYAEANKFLADTTPMRVGTAMQPLRDAVGDYLISVLGQKGSAWDKDKFVEAMTKVIACIKKFPEFKQP